MKNTNKTQRAAAMPGFAIQIIPDTDLGIGMLIVEDDEGHYEPLNAASTINEGKDMARHDLRFRLQRLERDEDPGLCPYLYKLWARGLDGVHQVAATWNASEL